jgi:hypothetical protein
MHMNMILAVVFFIRHLAKGWFVPYATWINNKSLVQQGGWDSNQLSQILFHMHYHLKISVPHEKNKDNQELICYRK